MNGVGEANGTPDDAAMDQGEDKSAEGIILFYNFALTFFSFGSFLSMCMNVYAIMIYAEKGVPDFWLNAMKNNEVLSEEVCLLSI